MKRILFIILGVVVFSLTLSGCGNSNETGSNDGVEAEAKKSTLKLSSYGPGTSPFHEIAVKPWIDRVEELSDGAIKLEFFPAEQLGKMGDYLQLTQSGVTDLSALQHNHFSDEMPFTNVIGSLPGNYKNSYQGSMAFDELLKSNSDIIETDYSQNGVKFLFSYTLPPFAIWTKEKEVRVPNDLEGMKVSVTGKIESKMIQTLGGTPVTMSWSDTYEALDRGIVDGVLMGINPVVTSGIDEIVQYHLPVKFGSYLVNMVINEEVWDGLPKNVQEAMSQASEEFEDIGKEFDEVENERLVNAHNNGITTVELEEDEKENWSKVLDDFTKKWLDENNPEGLQYEELLQEYEELTKKIE